MILAFVYFIGATIISTAAWGTVSEYEKDTGEYEQLKYAILAYSLILGIIWPLVVFVYSAYYIGKVND